MEIKLTKFKHYSHDEHIKTYFLLESIKLMILKYQNK